MRVLPVDPRAPTPAEMTAMYGVLCESFLHDHPGHPPRTEADLRGSLQQPWPGTRSACWLCLDGDEGMAFGWLRMPGGVNTDVAEVTLDVLPIHRRSGTGRTLLREAVRLAYSTGRSSVTGHGADQGPAPGFAKALGAREVLHDVRSVLGVRAATFTSADAPEAYELIRVSGPTPPDLLAGISAVHEGMADAPTGTSVATHQPYDSARVAAVDATLSARGLTQLRVVARQRGSGAVAAVSYVIISQHSPYRSEQGDTTVLPAHRGHGLGMSVKTEMLRWLRADYQQVSELNTWVARDNAPMRAINARLGYRDTATWTHWQAPVHELAGTLGLI